MRHIDGFYHFFPQGIFNKLSETTGGTRDIGKRIQGVLHHGGGFARRV
jgi:hypothetical protein